MRPCHVSCATTSTARQSRSASSPRPSAAVQRFLRTVSKVVGTEVIEDVVAFFRAFEGMEEGFRDRAASVLGEVFWQSAVEGLAGGAADGTG